MRRHASVGLALLMALHTAPAQTKRRPMDGSLVARLSVGESAPTSSELLAKAWSPGVGVDLSVEKYLTDRTTLNEFSLGVLMHYSQHPFDEAGFVKNIRPNGDTPTGASGNAANMIKLAAVGRVAYPNGWFSPNLSAHLGFFGSDRGDVIYTGSFGARQARMGSKFGLGIGLAVGADVELGRSALGLEGDWFMGSSNRDEVENYGRFTCNSSGCGIPRARTQVVSLHATLRQIIRR